MTTAQVPSRLARVMYRSMLRASHNGRHPQVFGTAGAQAFLSQAADEHLALALPSTPRQVLQRVKAFFRQGKKDGVGRDGNFNNDNDDDMVGLCAPLQVLRQVQQDSVANQLDNNGSALLVFDYDGVAALPGEIVSFCFVEPRYVKLGVQVWQSQRRQFLLRPSPNSNTASLLQLQSHLVLPNYMVAVTCRAGPRVFIRATTQEHVEGKIHPVHAHKYNLHTASSILSTATEYCLCPDKDRIDGNGDFADTRQYILHLLHCILPYQDSDLRQTLLAFGLPPLQPEAFSFWVLRHVLAVDDVKGRLEWLHDCRSTTRRLDFLLHHLKDILDYQEKQAA